MNIRTSVAAALTAMLLLGPTPLAHADDDDDDDDDSPRTSDSSIQIWPPTDIAWPPLAPADQSDDAADQAPVIPVP